MSNILDNHPVRIHREKLESILAERGLSISKFAKECGISRQSLYSMYRGRSIFSAPFEKILTKLSVDIEDILIRDEDVSKILSDAPDQILKTALRLQLYAEKHLGDIFLFGSRARGRRGIRADWDFAIFFEKGSAPKGFSAMKLDLQEKAFPYRIDLVCLNNAPVWFLRSIADYSIRISGKTRRDRVFKRKVS